MGSDEKNLDAALSDTNRSVGGNSTSSESSLQETPLIKARNTIYQHIKHTSVSEGHFFMQQDKNHKRELVAIMRRIDNQQINSGEELLLAMQHLAKEHQSEKFLSILNTIKSILESKENADISYSHNPNL